MLTKIARYIGGMWRGPISQFAGSDRDTARLNEELSGPLAEIFFSGQGRRVHKWVHYLPIYERYFSRFRHTEFRMLEIGVFGGGSLDMWREYFGPTATLFGIDINPECDRLATPPTQIRIGSQDDPQFLKSVVAEMGGLDVVLDDGSHIARHQRKSFDVLFPLLNEGGIYMIEDAHTSYWRRFGGGYRRGGTAIEFAKQICDDMHAWYHRRSPKTIARDHVGAVHFHDSIIVIEKETRSRPIHVVVDRRS